MKFDLTVPHNTMSVCVREVCQAAQALIDEYKDECISSVLQPQQNGGEIMGPRQRGVDAVRARWPLLKRGVHAVARRGHAVSTPWARSRSPTRTPQERDNTPWNLRRNATIAVGTP